MKPSSNAVGREAARKVHKNGSFLTPVSSRCSLQDHHTIQTLMKWDQRGWQKSAWVFHLIEQLTFNCNAFLFVEKTRPYLTENRWSQALNSLTTSNCQLLLGLMLLKHHFQVQMDDPPKDDPPKNGSSKDGPPKDNPRKMILRRITQPPRRMVPQE